MTDLSQTSVQLSSDAAQWVGEQLAAHSLTPIAPFEIFHTSLTSQVTRIPTDGGVLYFKQTAPLFRYEVALTERLAALSPDNLPRVYGIQPERGWLLLGDAGQVLRPLVKADGDFSRWNAMLPQFAQFQRKTTPHVETLLELGVPDMRLEKLPGLYDRLLADRDILRIDQPDGVQTIDLARLHAFRPQVAIMCERLAEYGLPATIHHDDFHDRNVALAADGSHYVFFDWAECGVTHPFCSMMIALRNLKLLHERDAATLDHMRDVYLAAWTDMLPMSRLLEAFTLAQRLGVLCRALTWAYVVGHVQASAEALAEIADAPPYWLLLFLDYDKSPEW